MRFESFPILTTLVLIQVAVGCRGSAETSPGSTSTDTTTHQGSSTGGTSTSSSSATGGTGGFGGTGTGGTSTGGAGTGGSGTGGTGTGGTGTGGSGTAGSGTGGLGTGGAGGVCAGAGQPAQIVAQGLAGQLLLKGMVVTPNVAFAGEVLVVGDTIKCADVSCSTFPDAATATVVDTHGIILPGLIDTHNHILFDIFDETDWSPLQSYTNHNQWTNEAKYGALVDTKQYLNGEGASPVDYGCELDKYGELKGLVAGTTSIVGAANPANRACYGSLARTIDQTPNGLGADKIQVATLFPTVSSADGVCTNFGAGKTDAYVIHIAEGVDTTARNEFAKLGTITTTDNCLYAPKTTIVHGAALGDPELATMAADGMSLVWSPRSNVFLYGGGVDLTKTANIPLAISKGINVALAPDWSIGGSQNLLDELRFADLVDNTVWSNQLTPKMLVQMVTTNAAKALGLGTVLGQLAPGFKADIMVIGGDPAAPYDALLGAMPADVRLTVVGGVALYGDKQLQSLGPAAPGCETIAVCCHDKFACVATKSSTSTDKLGQTFVEIESTLSTALQSYDALDLTQWKFSPITPLVRCP